MVYLSAVCLSLTDCFTSKLGMLLLWLFRHRMSKGSCGENCDANSSVVRIGGTVTIAACFDYEFELECIDGS